VVFLNTIITIVFPSKEHLSRYTPHGISKISYIVCLGDFAIFYKEVVPQKLLLPDLPFCAMLLPLRARAREDFLLPENTDCL
jgi:hypothetical protein